MKNIVIFGGTGRTGQCIVSYALDKGYLVRLLVRDESTIPDAIKGKTEVIKGDVTNPEAVDAALKGLPADTGVVVALGTRDCLDPTTVMSTGMQHIVTAMKKNNLSLVSVCLSAFLLWEPEKVPPRMRDITVDHRKEFEICKASGLQWRALFPPHITNEPSEKIEWAHDKALGRAVSKHDLGKFLVDCLTQEEHNQKIIGIITVPK